jgi:hypothetical protein
LNKVQQRSNSWINWNNFLFTTVDLNDVSGIKNPLDKVQPGLVSTSGEM